MGIIFVVNIHEILKFEWSVKQNHFTQLLHNTYARQGFSHTNIVCKRSGKSGIFIEGFNVVVRLMGPHLPCACHRTIKMSRSSVYYQPVFHAGWRD